MLKYMPLSLLAIELFIFEVISPDEPLSATIAVIILLHTKCVRY